MNYRIYAGSFPLIGEYSEQEADRIVTNIQRCITDPVRKEPVDEKRELGVVNGGKK